MNNPEQLRSLLLEIAEHMESPTELAQFEINELITLARAAASELRERREPTDEEILACRSWSIHGPTFDSDLVQFGRDLLARYGGGEVQ